MVLAVMLCVGFLVVFVVVVSGDIFLFVCF